LILVMPVIGQKLVLPLFVVVYLWWWSEFGWRLIVCALTWAALIVFYDQILHVFSYSAALSDWLPRGAAGMAAVMAFRVIEHRRARMFPGRQCRSRPDRSACDAG
jgi:hypothetical protein